MKRDRYYPIMTGLGGLLVMFLAVARLGAADYADITTNMDSYVLREQTDTWTRCMMTVDQGMVIESNAVAGFISTTNQCWLPENGAHIQDNYVGRNGAGSVWATNSTIKAIGAFSVGAGTNGSMRLTDSTFELERSPNSGTFNFYVGINSGIHTGELDLVNSSLFPRDGLFHAYMSLSAAGCFSRLTARNSRIGSSSTPIRIITSYETYGAPPAIPAVDRAVGWFDASTVTVWRCCVGGDNTLGKANGRFTFTNGSLFSLPSGYEGETWPGLYVGESCDINYTSTVAIVGSRLENLYNTFVGVGNAGYGPGNGRLAFSDNAVGVLNANVSLGVISSGRGFLDVSSGSRVYVTNTLGTATLQVGIGGYGKLLIDGGTCRVDCLYLTNGINSVLALSNGMLSVKSGVISNSATLTVGDGVSGATLNQWGAGTTTVYGAVSFTNNSQWQIEPNGANDTGVLDVYGSLAFDANAALSVVTTNSSYAFLNERTIAYADAVSSLPHVTSPGNQITVRVRPSGARYAIVILPLHSGTIISIR